MRLLLTALLILWASPALSQPTLCGPTGAVERQIADRYGESVAGAGITSSGGVIFTTTNPDTGTFTVMIRGADGKTCILASGTGWASVEADRPRVGL